MALAAGVSPRTLQEFLEIHRWDPDQVRARLQAVVMQEHADAHAIGAIDETSYAKKGTHTAGVQPQYCGATGKTDNCVVTVHLGYVSQDFHALIDSDLFLPEHTWGADRDRCRAAGIPDEVGYRPKWRIGLDLLARSWAQGVRLEWLVADEDYGQGQRFRHEVASYGIWYVVEVPCSLKGWTHRPATVQARTRQRLASWAKPSRRVDQLWQRGGPSWEAFHVKDTDKGAVVWEVRRSRFYPWEEGLPGPEQWLLVARQVLTGEIKYFLSNAPQDTPVTQLIDVAFSRSHIERLFEDAKGQVGLDHFEVRKYQPLMRHLVLSMVSLLFLVRQALGKGGKKTPGVCISSGGSLPCCSTGI
jgi:SRSO17 transposase